MKTLAGLLGQCEGWDSAFPASSQVIPAKPIRGLCVENQRSNTGNVYQQTKAEMLVSEDK